jgi:hypothetical protein
MFSNGGPLVADALKESGGEVAYPSFVAKLVLAKTIRTNGEAFPGRGKMTWGLSPDGYAVARPISAPRVAIPTTQSAKTQR